MGAYVIAYDLRQQGQNYTCVTKKLSDLGAWHMQGSVWILKTDSTAVQIRDHLLPCLDSNDKLFVGKLSAAAWQGLGDQAGTWLRSIIP